MEKFEKITQLNAEVKQIKGTRASKPLFLMHMISKFIVQPVTEFQVVSVIGVRILSLTQFFTVTVQEIRLISS